jgi:hypothetical protein
VPRRSASIIPDSRSTSRWCEIVGAFRSKASVSSHTRASPPSWQAIIDTRRSRTGWPAQPGEPTSLDHLGVEVESTDEVEATGRRLEDARLVTFSESDTDCCTGEGCTADCCRTDSVEITPSVGL